MTSLHQKDPHNFKQGHDNISQQNKQIPIRIFTCTLTLLTWKEQVVQYLFFRLGTSCRCTRRCRREAMTEAIGRCLPMANTGPPLCCQARTGRRGCTGARRGPHQRAVRRCFLPDSGSAPRGTRFQLGKMAERMSRTTASSASISAWQDGREDVEDDG